MKWLLDLAREHRLVLLSASFYDKTLAEVHHPENVKGWIRQLYHQSSDFTSALALRYSMCRDPRYQNTFARHAAEEVEHAAMLLDWMHKHDFLKPGENPISIPPT